MAKIRIYELARDLNMTNKDLLDKLKSMDVDVKSHASSIDDDTVASVKAELFGKKPESVEEIRVQKTVIRRRKKKPVAAEEPVIKAAASVPEPEPEAPPEAEPEAPKTTEAPEEAEKPAAVAKKKKKKEPAAKVIKPAEKEPEEPVKEVETVPVEEPIAKEVPAEERASVEPEVKADVPAEKPEISKEKPAEKPASKKKAVKKSKKDRPAKIIALPPEPLPGAEKSAEKPAPSDKPKKRARKSAVATATPAPAEEVSADSSKPSKKKKGRKSLDGAEVEGDKKFFKKRISFRKKEVVEGADLYVKGKKRGKGKKGGRGAVATGQKTQITVPKAIKRRVKIDDTIILAELAKRMGIKSGEMIMKLMELGVMVTVNQTIDFDTAVLVASEFDYELERASFEEEAILKVETDEPETLQPRPPVVTIMGHVDHGKTSLLDVIRKTRVTDGEAGGITQHIGAYNVSTSRGKIAFLDTPGHEAFTAMRARGSQVTDIVILVVAADDGVKPQTIEAINHSKAAEVPMIVAVNKMDKPGADPDRVLRELSENDVLTEEWGGETLVVKVSAKDGSGIDDLLDLISLQAEMMELTANPNKHAKGHVVEAKLDAGRGPVATVLIQEGTLKSGDSVVCGIHFGKIRALLNDKGKQVTEAGPSMPVEIIGLSGVPMAGDELVVLEDEKSARQVGMHRQQKQRSKDLAKSSRLSLEGLFERMQEGELKDLNLILKADVHGSIEALRDSLVKLSNKEVNINITHSATGTITDSDVSLAAVSDAIIMGFNVRPSTKVQALAAEENVDIRFYNIIYKAIEDVENAIVGMMASTFEERILGNAEVRDVFHVPKIGAIAGCYVTDGKMERGQSARLLREGVVMYDGKIGSLRRFKDDVKEVQGGYECGIGIENYNDIKVGDIIECYFMEEIRPDAI
ncbi:MAG: translation initiation factor IF-2 [Desulfobacterales bacterium]|nr:translation initiation factor IF-2 [Desulfobacterales bacterium]